MTQQQLAFTVFCIEGIAEALEQNGADVYQKLINHPSNLLQSYIVEHYDVLHTQSKSYIVEEILELMQQKGVL